MNFKHNYDWTKPEVLRELVDGKHYYICDGKAYPSVTTILKDTANTFYLDKWRNDVGEDVAQHISDTATAIGTECHSINEHYLNNFPLSTMPCKNKLYGMAHHNNMRPYLDKIETVYGTEVGVVSETHSFAGTADCIGVYNKQLSVIDFKCKTKPQKKYWMKDFFLQVAAYAKAFEEMTGLEIKRGVVLASSSHDTMQEEIIKVDKYWPLFMGRLQEYHGDHRPKRKGIKVP